jgi:hypothetical protein
MKAALVAAVLLSAAAGIGAGGAGAASQPRPAPAGEEEADRRLDALIESGLRAGGRFFTAAETAVIERKCGYAPGEWDGFQINMVGKVFYCTNGRRVNDPELHAVMRAASPRINARVKAVMSRPDVKAAVAEVAKEAEREALAELAKERRRRR